MGCFGIPCDMRLLRDSCVWTRNGILYCGLGLTRACLDPSEPEDGRKLRSRDNAVHCV